MMRLPFPFRLSISTALSGICLSFAMTARAQEGGIPIAQIQRDTPVDFEMEVLPALKRSCIACHNAATAESRLSLETPQTILQGGDSGPAVTPKNSADSMLLLYASHQSEPIMPPKGNKVNAPNLTSDELGLLKLWIDQGAEGTVTGRSVLNWQPLPPGVNPIYAVAITPDGQFAAAGRANQIFIYHLPSNQVVCRLTDPALLSGGVYDQPGVAHLDIVQSLAFNPAGDLLASSGYREVKLWRRPANLREFNLAASAPVAAVAVSPDRKWLATGAEDNSIVLWDLTVGQQAATLAGHTAAVTSLAFSADGARLVSGSLDKSIRQWSVPQGQALGRIDAVAPVNAVALAGPEGNLIASAGGENVIRLWNAPTEASRRLADLPTPVAVIASSPDKKLLAVGGGDGRVALVDALTGTVTKAFAAHEGGVTSLSFNAGNNRLVTAGADKMARVWDLAADPQLAAVSGGALPVDAVAINPAGTQVASAWGDGQVAIWKIDVPVARALAGDNGAAATLAVVSPNNQLLATDGVVDGQPAIILRDIASGNVVRSIVGHEGAIAALAFSPDSARLASGSADKTARVWNVADGAQVASFAGHTNTVTGVAFNSNGQQVISGAADNTLKLWNTADVAELKDFAGHTAPLVGVAMAANDQFIVSTAGDNTVRVWNPADGAQLRAMDVAAPATAMALSRDLARLAVAGADNAVKVFQVADGALLFTLAGHGAPARSLAFSPDNTRLVSAGPDNQALVWELTAGKLIEVVPVAAGLTAAAYGPDVNTLLVAAADKSIQALPVHFERLLEGNAMPISGLAYSNDGGMVYTASQDGTVRGYGAADGGQRFAANHGAAVHDLALSADGQWLASAGEDKFVRIWNAGNGGGGPMPQLGPFQAAARSVCFTRDNLRVVGGSAGNEVTVFDLQTGQPAQANAEHAAAVASLDAVGETVPTIVSASADGMVLMWPILAVRQMTGHAGPVTSLAAIPTVPTQIISGSEDGTVRQWNLDNGSEMRQFGHGGPITSVAVRPDGKRFASASSNNIAKLWNAENGQPVAELRGDLRLQGLLAVANKELQKGTALVATRKAELDAAQKDVPVKTEAATKAAEALAAAVKASEEKAAAKKVADDAKAAADKASVDAAAAFKVAEEAFNTAKAAADGDANNADLAKAKTDAEAALAVAKKAADDAAAAAAAAVKPVEEATAALTAADQVKQTAQKASDEAALLQKKAEELVPTSTTAVTQAEEAVKVLEAGVQQATATATAGEMPIRAVAFAPDNIQLATGGDDMTVHTWNSETGAPLETYKGHAGIVRSLAFADNTKLVSGAADNSAALWDLVPNWTLERTIGGIDSADFIDRVISLGFSPDGALLATGGGEPSRSGELKIWNVADGALVRELVDAHSDTVFGVDFSANGKLLASCAADKFVKVFDVSTGERVRSFEGHTHHVLGVTWKDDATRLVSCGADNAIKVWNFETGDQLATIPGYSKQVTSISFMGDSPNTVSSGGDATVRFHNTDNNQNYRNFSGAIDFVYSAAATPDGKLVIAGGQDSVLRLWNGESGALLQSFAPPPAEDPAASTQAAK